MTESTIPVPTDDRDGFRLLVETLPQIVWTAGRDGRPDWYNGRWYEYTGAVRRVAAAGESDWPDFLHPDDAERARAAWQQALASGEPYSIECRLRGRDGSHRWFVTRALPAAAQPGGRPARWFGTCTDIDDQKQAQRLSDSFVALISHALRTPLNAILGWTQVLQKRPDDVATVRQVADIVERNARLQARMVDQLLDASRIASGDLALSLEPLDLRDVVGPAVAAVRATAQAHRIELLEQTGAAPVRLVGDAQRLGEMVDQLLANALQNTPDGGRIAVRVRTAGDRAVLEVADSGRGLALADLGRVFDRFRQVDAPLSGRSSGLGLGLSIARDLVALHRGSIDAASAGPGRGALFTVRLPLAQAAPHVGPAAQPAVGAVPVPVPAVVPAVALPADALAGLRVLVVDDEADSRALVARVLRDAGAVVTPASGADEVSMALGGGLRPDLVVSDLGMPRVDGYSLVRMLHALPGAIGGVPTIALSGLNLPQDRARAAQAGFLAFITKPFSPAELVAVAARLTGRLA